MRKGPERIKKDHLFERIQLKFPRARVTRNRGDFFISYSKDEVILISFTRTHCLICNLHEFLSEPIKVIRDLSIDSLFSALINSIAILRLNQN